MSASFAELATAWGRSSAALDEGLRGTDIPAERAGRLASLLQPLAPEGLSACQLTAAGTSWRAWQAGAYRPPPELNNWLEEEFAAIDPLGSGAIRAPRLEERLGLRTCLAASAHEGRAWGILLLAYPEQAGDEWSTLAEALLPGMAHTLALRLQLEAAGRERRELLEQLANGADAALVGEAALGLVHDLNNCLNSMLLQASIVQMRAPPDLRQGLEVIRSNGKQAAALMRPLQQGRRERSEGFRRVDLNEIVREVRDAEPEGERGVQLDLAPQLRHLLATREGLKTIVRWLLHTALSRQPGGAGSVSVRTWGEGERVLLAVADGGPGVPEPILEHLQDAEEEGILVRSHLLERLAGQSLLRQFGGTLQAQAKPGGGVILTIEWS